jgi:hypothetical protein
VFNIDSIIDNLDRVSLKFGFVKKPSLIINKPKKFKDKIVYGDERNLKFKRYVNYFNKKSSEEILSIDRNKLGKIINKFYDAGFSFRRISYILKMSDSTAGKILNKYKQGN